MHQHSVVADHVLPSDIGNHTFYLAGAAPARQVPPVHYDTGWIQCRDHHYYTEHSLSQAEHTQDGTVGQEVLYTTAAKIAPDAGAERFA